MKSPLWKICATTPLIFWLSCSPSWLAEIPNKHKAKTPPAWLKTVNLTKAGTQAPLKACRVRYILSWNHLINAGEVSMSMRDGKSSPSTQVKILAGEASARSTGLARLLWSYDCELQSKTDQSTLQPLSFKHTETENGESVSYQTAFKKGRVETLRREKDSASGEIKLKKRTFEYPHCYDLLSSILTLRSLPLKKGHPVVAVVQPFDLPYLVTFTTIGREKRKYLGKLRPTIKLSVQVQKINKDLSLKKYKKLKTATLWVSEDDYRLPLELRADIFIGYVSATLVEREFLKSK